MFGRAGAPFGRTRVLYPGANQSRVKMLDTAAAVLSCVIGERPVIISRLCATGSVYVPGSILPGTYVDPDRRLRCSSDGPSAGYQVATIGSIS